MSGRLNDIGELLMQGQRAQAIVLAESVYPFSKIEKKQRRYTQRQALSVFIRDGFIDRYSGERLYHPAYLRLLHHLLPEQFPFHPHGVTGKCHDMFWDLLPSIDHLVPIHRGGADDESNWVCTSMKRNMAKCNFNLEDIGWTLHEPGNIKDWDGCSAMFLQLQEQFRIEHNYIKTWYRLTDAMRDEFQ